jgi:hypothetical protein
VTLPRSSGKFMSQGWRGFAAARSSRRSRTPGELAPPFAEEMPLPVHSEAPRVRKRARSPSRGSKAAGEGLPPRRWHGPVHTGSVSADESARHPLKAGACPGSPDPGVARSLKSRAVCEQSCAVRSALLGCGGSARGSKGRVEKALEGRNAQESTAAPMRKLVGLSSAGFAGGTRLRSG